LRHLIQYFLHLFFKYDLFPSIQNKFVKSGLSQDSWQAGFPLRFPRQIISNRGEFRGKE
jgi:hypothetical protein